MVKVHLYVTSASGFSSDLFRHFPKNANFKSEHQHLLPWDPFLKFDANADANVT